MPKVTKFIILTGLPGVGKTTLVRKCCDTLKENGSSLHGFYTEELRDKGKRIGFDIVTLDNERAALSRIEDTFQPGGKPEPKVGQYSVKLMSFESLALPALTVKDQQKHIIVIDEIGKMELFSQNFIRTVKSIMKNDKVLLFATIPVARGKPLPLVEELRHDNCTKLFEITKENRTYIQEDILQSIRDSFEQI